MSLDSPILEIKSRINIVDLVREYVPLLRQTGSNYKACCPFHKEKTPSFMVSEDRQMWYCFGACSEGGDIFDFVKKIEGMDFPEALRLLAKRANVVLKRQDPRLITQRTRIQDALSMAAHFFESNLNEPVGSRAKAYLKSRKIEDEALLTFHVGYAPESWDATKEYLIGQGFSAKEVELAGLSIPRERGSGSYDRFRHRVMFPIPDVHGTIVGFGGRRLSETEEAGAKYINSPQTSVYDKSRVIYGLSEAKPAIREQKKVVLVEGYLDVLTAHQAGFRNVVAVSGTALAQAQVDLLKRFTSTIVLAFDTDAAGLEAVNRGVRTALQSDMNILVTSFRPSDGKDPDEIIRKHPTIFEQGVAGAKPFVDYYFDRVLAQADLKKVYDKKQVARVLLSVISQLSDPVERSHYIQRLAAELRVSEQVILQTLRQHWARQRPSPPSTASDGSTSTPPGRKTDDLSSQLLGFALLRRPFIPHLVASLNPEDFPTPDLQSLAKKIAIEYTKDENFSLDRLSPAGESGSAEPQTQRRFVDRLILQAENLFAHLSDDEQEREFLSLMSRFKRQVLRGTLLKLSLDLQRAEGSGDAASVEQLSKQFEYLTTTLAQLDS